MVFKHMYFTKNATRKEKQLLLSNQHWVMYLEVTQPFHGPLLIIMLMTPNHLSSCYVLQKVVLLQDGRLPTLPMPFIHIQLMAQLLVEDLIFIYAIIVILQIAATPIQVIVMVLQKILLYWLVLITSLSKIMNVSKSFKQKYRRK